MSNHDTAPRDRYCDLVMKGGVTSGIVYPKAIHRLAQHYRFKNIGGSSAGAIAAAVTAAAEYQRRRSGSGDGFELLRQLPETLAERRGARGPSRLLRLFQPQAGTKRLFSVLVCALNRGGTGSRMLHIVRGLLLAYWPATLASLLLGLLVWRQGGGLAGGLTLLLASVGLVLVCVYRDVTHHVANNGFGLCNGNSERGHGDAALMPWLHELIQRAAGRSAQEAPLTFGDLWAAPGFPPAGMTLPPGAEVKSIHLQMFTTNLSHGRPYVFPLEEGDPAQLGMQYAATRQRLFWRSDELAPYLPPDVLAWLSARSRAYAVDPERTQWDPATADGAGLLEIPPPQDFPIVLAARMSLSFPLLISAVPLWAIDYDSKEGTGRRKFCRCWFSDGGLSSNFPIHMFDSLVPAWPTFGIMLEPKLAGRPNMIFLPDRYWYGYGERWQRFGELTKPGSRMGGFLLTLVRTMQEWSDNTLSRMPGVRDRVVRLRLNPDEGGLNLDMSAETMARVAARGEEAAEALLARYLPPESAPRPTGWDEQRWVRLGVLLSLLHKRLPDVRHALAEAAEWEGLIELARSGHAAGFDRAITDDEAEALRELRTLLLRFADELLPLAERFGFVPIPEPELRVRPAL